MATEEKDVLRLFLTYAASMGGSKRRQRVYATDTKQLLQHNDSDDTIASEWSDDTLQCLLDGTQTLTGQKTFNEKILFPDDHSIGDDSGDLEIATTETGADIKISVQSGDAKFIIDSGDVVVGDCLTIAGTIGGGAEVEVQPGAEFKVAASVSGHAGLTLQEGVAPSFPVDGEVWLTATDLIARVNGVSESLIANASTHVLIAGAQDIEGAKTFEAVLTCEDDLVVGTNVLVADQSEGKVGIGTTDPDGLLHIHQGSVGTVTSNSMLTLENDGDAEMQFLAPSANKMLINFGDAAASNIGHIEYNNNGDYMGFRTGGSERLRLNSTGATFTGKLILPNSNEIYDDSGHLKIVAGSLNDMTLESYADMSLIVDSGDIILNPSAEIIGQGNVNLATGNVFKINDTQVLGPQGAALTTGLTSITHTAPGTPDYAIQNLTNSSPFGFATQDEGNTVLSVILNNQTRISEMESRLQAHGIIA